MPTKMQTLIKAIAESVEAMEKLQETLEPNTKRVDNDKLQVGDKIVTKYDKRSGRATAGVRIREIDFSPRSCRGKSHIKGDSDNINGCYDHAATTVVFL